MRFLFCFKLLLEIYKRVYTKNLKYKLENMIIKNPVGKIAEKAVCRSVFLNVFLSIFLQVKVGDKECDVMDGFRLYITTKLGNPAYTPEVWKFRTCVRGFHSSLLAFLLQCLSGENFVSLRYSFSEMFITRAMMYSIFLLSRNSVDKNKNISLNYDIEYLSCLEFNISGPIHTLCLFIAV